MDTTSEFKLCNPGVESCAAKGKGHSLCSLSCKISWQQTVLDICVQIVFAY